MHNSSILIRVLNIYITTYTKIMYRFYIIFLHGQLFRLKLENRNHTPDMLYICSYESTKMPANYNAL